MEENLITNRDKKLSPRRTKFWCWGCDANHISPGGKCKVCGYKDPSKRKKK